MKKLLRQATKKEKRKIKVDYMRLVAYSEIYVKT